MSTLKFSPDRRHLAVGTRDGAVYLLEAPEKNTSSLYDFLRLLISHKRASLPEPSTPLPFECSSSSRDARRDREDSSDDEGHSPELKRQRQPKRSVSNTGLIGRLDFNECD